MVQPFSASDSATSVSTRPSRVASAIVAVAAASVGLMVVGAVGLWVHYGTAVFFEMVKSGIAACM
jgi:hypothetical protein